LVQSLELLDFKAMNNKIMELMGRNEWDTPNVRRACKGAFEPQDRLEKDARQKRAKADKPFYKLLEEMAYQQEKARIEALYWFVERVKEQEKARDWKDTALHWEENCAKLREETKKQKTQIKGQKTRIKNLKNQ